MNKNCSILGCGRMFNLHHFQNINKAKFKIKKIFDPRKKLIEETKKKINFKEFCSNYKEFIKNNNCKFFFVFLPRDISFYFLNLLLNKKNIVIFAEKPPVLFEENFRKIITKVKKNNNKIYLGYQFSYSYNFLKYKNIIKKINIKEIDSIKTEMSLNYKMKKNKKYNDKIKSSYKELVPKNLKSNIVDYKIFLNRYSHLLDLMISIFPEIKFCKKIKYDLFNYLIFLKYKNIPVTMNVNNKSHYKIKLSVLLKNKKYLNINMITLRNFCIKFENKGYNNTNSSIENLYFNEIKNLIDKKINYQIKNFLKIIKITKMITLN